MSDSFQYGDIIFLGLIAIFLALRLRAMLGKNSGIDPRDVWKPTVREAPVADKTLLPIALKKPTSEEEVVPVNLQGNQAVSAGLRAIRSVDPHFSATEFLSGSKLAFEWLVSAFAKGDKDKLKLLLSDERYQHFADEINARAQTGTYPENTLVSIEAADITEAAIIKGRAQITVQFTTEQIHVMRDQEKNVVSGDISAIEKVIDIWTFERDPASRDPNWKIIAT